MQLAISTLITIGSSCIRLIALKSSVAKVMGSMLGTRCREIMLTDRTCWRCLFHGEVVAPPLVKPLTMVFITRFGWLRGLFSLFLERLRLLHLFDRSACSWSLPRLDLGLFLPLGLHDFGLWMNSFRWPSLMSSFILSFKALHYSIEWPWLWWYRQCYE